MSADLKPSDHVALQLLVVLVLGRACLGRRRAEDARTACDDPLGSHRLSYEMAVPGIVPLVHSTTVMMRRRDIVPHVIVLLVKVGV